MKEKLSALIDGELSELEGRRLLNEVAVNPGLKQLWHRFHLIRAVLRHDLTSTDNLLGVKHTLAQIAAHEPIPNSALQLRHSNWGKLLGSLAIAASVAALTLFSLQAMFGDSPGIGNTQSARQSLSNPAFVVRENPMRWESAEPENQSRLNVYLVEHTEFAPLTGMNGMMPYGRVVAYDREP
jgi:sigma-E factor negative regulatory protein RseA